MRSKKSYVILLVILVIFAIAMYFLVAKKNIKEDSDVTTIIVGNTSIWNYENKRWTNITRLTSIEKINWREFDVYEDGDYLGKYSAWSDGSKWYYFDENKDSINVEGNVLAYRSNFKINIDKFSESQIDSTDSKYINHVLEENDLSISSKFTSNYKVEIDYDNDGNEETFYVLTNAFPMDFDPEEIFSIVFMAKDNKVYYLYKDIDTNKNMNGCKPYFNYFFDLNEDKVDEIVLSCGKYSEKGTVDMLYKFVDDEFKIQISNQ